MRELSLRPYTGRLFITKTKKEYESAHKKLFKTPDILNCSQIGRFSGGEGKDGIWTYLVYAESPSTTAHEFSHVIFHVFDRCGIAPDAGNEEPFCYLLGQLILDASKKKNK